MAKPDIILSKNIVYKIATGMLNKQLFECDLALGAKATQPFLNKSTEKRTSGQLFS